MPTTLLLFLTMFTLQSIDTARDSVKVFYRSDSVSSAAAVRLAAAGAQAVMVIDGSIDKSKKQFRNASPDAVVAAVSKKYGNSLPQMALIDLPWAIPMPGATEGDATARMVSLVRALKASYPATKWAWRAIPAIDVTPGPTATSTSNSITNAAVTRWRPLGAVVDWMNPDSTLGGAPPLESSAFAEWTLNTQTVCNQIARDKEVIPAVTQWQRTVPTRKGRKPLFTVLPMQSVLSQIALMRTRGYGAVLFAESADLPRGTAQASSTTMSTTVEALRLRENAANNSATTQSPVTIVQSTNTTNNPAAAQTTPAAPAAPAVPAIPAAPTAPTAPAVPAVPAVDPAALLPFAQQAVATKVQAERALAQIPQRLLTEAAVEMTFVPTDWNAIFERAGESNAVQGMIPQLVRMAEVAFTANRDRYVRPDRFEAIPTDMLDQATIGLQPTLRRDRYQLATIDCKQTSYLRSQGVPLAIVAHRTRNPEYLAKCIDMLEALNTYQPLQRPGSTYWDQAVPMADDGDGVWLATAWGIDAIVEMVSALGDDVPPSLRGRLEKQLRDEVERITKDWADKRPWFVKSRKCVSNQWIEPNVALIKACLFLKDPRLFPAYELGAENIRATLAALGSDGAYNEGITYGEMSLGRLHEVLQGMRLAGDLRCSGSDFARNNWRWFVQMHMPGRMLVNSYDSGLSKLPAGSVNVPLASLGAAAIATTDPEAIAMMKYLYPAMKGNYSLEAIKFAAALEATPGLAQPSIEPFAYFPSQQQLVWRSAFQAPSAPQTAFGLWMRGGSLSDNHCQRDQGQVSIYCGNRQVFIDCGLSEYASPDYNNFYSAAAGHSTMQFGGLAPNGKPVHAPITVNTLNQQGGSVSIDCSAGFPSTSQYTRAVEWSLTGDVQLVDRVKFQSPVSAATELFRFHTGTADVLAIQGSGREWEVTWRGVAVRLGADVDIDVTQATFPDRVTASNTHQAIVVRCASVCSEINLTTTVKVNTSETD